MDKGSIASACCIEAGVLAGEVRSILHLRLFPFYIFGVALHDGNKSNPVKLWHKDCTLPAKSSTPASYADSDCEYIIYASNDSLGETVLWQIDKINLKDLSTHGDLNTPAMIEIDIDTNRVISTRLTTKKDSLPKIAFVNRDS